MIKALKILLAVIAAAAVVAGGATIYVNSKLDKISYSESKPVEQLTPNPELESTGEERSDIEFEMPTEEKAEDGGIVNILLLGTDLRIPNSSDPGRADCNMLCSINKGTGEIKLVSFERGIFVPIPQNLMPYGGTSDLLTHAFHWGGPDLSQSIISTCFNIELAGYAQVDFDTFADVVDEIGGIDIELTQTESDALNRYRYTNTQSLDRTVEPGVNHLNGYETLQYCRLRFTDDDWVRQNRQRNAVTACFNKIKTLNLLELNSLADRVLPHINTNLSKQQITGLLFAAPKILSGPGIATLQVPDKNMTETRYIECNFDYESKKISNFIYGTEYELKCPYTSVKPNYYEGHTIGS